MANSAIPTCLHARGIARVPAPNTVLDKFCTELITDDLLLFSSSVHCSSSCDMPMKDAPFSLPLE